MVSSPMNPFKIWSLLGNSQKLDGGAMFGNAPKAMWSRWLSVDELNRVDLACRCLLLQAGERWVLFETGIGNFFSPKLQERYGVQESDHRLLNSLQQLQLLPEQITDVVLSHLHFDHAGGLLSSFVDGQPSHLLFSKAKYYVGNKAFQRAQHPHARDRASFIPELVPLLLESHRLELVTDPLQHSLAGIVKFHFSDGHTPGLMLAEILGPQRRVLFVSDLIPGTAWVHVPITMGYDRYAELLIDEKKDLLGYCQQAGVSLFYTHDPAVALSEVVCADKGRFSPHQPLSEVVGMDI